MDGISTLPPYEKKSFARWVYQSTLAYFENPDVQARFEKWKKEKDAQSMLQGGDGKTDE